jgi:hypothetical protein
MDRVAKGMSEAGRQAKVEHEDSQHKDKGMVEKAKEMAKGTAAKVGECMTNTGQKLQEAAR